MQLQQQASACKTMASPSGAATNEQDEDQQQRFLMSSQGFGYGGGGYANHCFYPGQGGWGQPPQQEVHRKVHLPSNEQQQQQQHWAGPPPTPNDHIFHDSSSDSSRMEVMASMHSRARDDWQQPPPAFHAPSAPQPQPLQFPSSSYANNHPNCFPHYPQHQQGNSSSYIDVFNASYQQQQQTAATASHPPPPHGAGPSVSATQARARGSPNVMQTEYALLRGNYNYMMNHNNIITNANTQSTSSMVPPTNMGYPTQPTHATAPFFDHQYHDISERQCESAPGEINIIQPPMYNPNKPHQYVHPTTNPIGMMPMTSSSTTGNVPDSCLASSETYQHHQQRRQQQNQEQHNFLPMGNGLVPMDSSSPSFQFSSSAATHQSTATTNNILNVVSNQNSARSTNTSSTNSGSMPMSSSATSYGALETQPQPLPRSNSTVNASANTTSFQPLPRAPPPPISSLTVSTTASSRIMPMKKDTMMSSSGSNPHNVDSSEGEGEVLQAAAAVVDATSHDYLRKLLRSKKRSAATVNNALSSSLRRKTASTTTKPIKDISIPSTFSPTHSYRASAAYSLLRTLSKELRLSPFTFQAFANALMLPVPSKLLGEVHARVLRVLFAAAAVEDVSSSGGMGRYFYDKFGDGGSVDMIRRRKRTIVRKTIVTDTTTTVAGGDTRLNDDSDESNRPNKDVMEKNQEDDRGGIEDGPSALDVVKYEDEDEFVPKKGGNNLAFLDQSTWPLFFQDYALATEERLLEIFDSGDAKSSFSMGRGTTGIDDDNDEFIDMRSVAMLPSEDINLHPTTVPKIFDDADYDDDEDDEVVSTQVGNFNNSTNGTNCASRCPVGPLGRRNHLGRFVCCPFHILTAVQMYRDMLTPAATSVAGSGIAMPTAKKKSSTGVMKNGATSRQSLKGKRKPRRRSSINKWSDDDDTDDDNDSDVETDDDEYKPPANYDNYSTRAIRASKIDVVSSGSGVGIRPPSSSLNSFPAVGWKAPQCQAIRTPGHGPSTNAIAVSRSPLTNIQQTLIHHHSNVDATTTSFRPIVLPEAQQLCLPDECALVVSSKIEKALDSLFSNRHPGSSKVESIGSDHDAEKSILTNCFHRRPGEACNDRITAHMVSVHRLERGIPHHHLCLNDKLAILEFLLDELLQVTEIADEMTRRQDHTSQYSSLYGAIPSPRDFEEMENADECNICGIEGQLLCCDGCPGSYHRTCIGIAPNAKLPEGKWLCPECKIVDASKMAPLTSDSRPLIKWFTLSELGWPAFYGTSDGASNIHCTIPSDVEFLVTSGLVFARYRTTLEPFDPLRMSTTPNLPVLRPLTPPSPLQPHQLAELLKLLGPMLCSYMPWLRIPFNPQHFFFNNMTHRNEEASSIAGQAPLTNTSIIQYDNYVRFLIYYQDKAKEFLACHPEFNNPIVYSNGYYRAPSIPLINNHQGQHLIAPDSQVYPAKTSTLAVAILDMTVHRDQNTSISYFDPMKSIRNSMIQLEKTLDNACLLDLRWSTHDHAAYWRKMVNDSKSVRKLGSLLVELIDSCSIIAFVADWYKPKECSTLESSRLGTSKWVSILSEEWNVNRESTRRKWERSGANDILRLHNGVLGSSVTKRGKVKKNTDFVKAPRADGVSKNNQGDIERNSLDLSTSRRRSDRFSSVRQQIETILDVTDLELSDSEREILDLKIDRLEHTLAEEADFSINWPIAGKMLFEPDGSLPRPIIRHLARNAGSSRAPSITYDTAYDVGETALCHRWRKITSKCTTYEGLLCSLRFVNAHIHKATVVSATAAANQKTRSAKDIIRCVHTDPCTGFKEYFVVPVNKKSGRWYSEQSVEIVPFIHQRCEQKKTCVPPTQIHDRIDASIVLSGKKREATTAFRVDTNVPTAKKTRVESKAKQVDSRLQIVIDNHRDGFVSLLHDSAATGKKSVSADLLEDLRSKNLIKMRHANLQIHNDGGDLLGEFELKNRLTEAEKEGRKQVTSDRRRALNEKKRDLHAIVNRHRAEIIMLMKQISARGESIVGSTLIESARSKNLIEFRSTNLLVEQLGGKLLTECELESRMAKAEEEAGRAFEISEKEGIRREKEREFRSVVDMHRDVFVSLLKESVSRGEASINTSTLECVRARNLTAMRAANLASHKAGGVLLGNFQLNFQLTKAEEAASKIFLASRKRSSVKSAMIEPPDTNRDDTAATIREKEREFQAAVDKHRDDTLRLMKESALKGETNVSTEGMTTARNMNFTALAKANRSLNQAGGTLLVDFDLKARIARAEEEAVAMYIREELHSR